MDVWIEAFGFAVAGWTDGRCGRLSLETPIALMDLLDLLNQRWQVQTVDKTVLVNGVYQPPRYLLQDGDRVQVLRMMEGG